MTARKTLSLSTTPSFQCAALGKPLEMNARLMEQVKSFEEQSCGTEIVLEPHSEAFNLPNGTKTPSITIQARFELVETLFQKKGFTLTDPNEHNEPLQDCAL